MSLGGNANDSHILSTPILSRVTVALTYKVSKVRSNPIRYPLTDLAVIGRSGTDDTIDPRGFRIQQSPTAAASESTESDSVLVERRGACESTGDRLIVRNQLVCLGFFLIRLAIE